MQKKAGALNNVKIATASTKVLLFASTDRKFAPCAFFTFSTSARRNPKLMLDLL